MGGYVGRAKCQLDDQRQRRRGALRDRAVRAPWVVNTKCPLPARRDEPFCASSSACTDPARCHRTLLGHLLVLRR
jgi:hypothetical protein